MIEGLSEKLERILEAGNTAPSGENCQPWHFYLRGTSVDITLRPERDQSLYNWGQRSSYLALGAVVENMSIAATHEGMRCEVSYFQNQDKPLLVATLAFHADLSVVPDHLGLSISKRVSNRNPYAVEALPPDVIRVLGRCLESYPGALHLTEERTAIRELGRVGSTNEEIMLANKALHAFFFSHVNWTKEEDEKKKVGFYIKTLELPAPARSLFRVFQHWPIMRILNVFGFNKIAATQNAATNSSAAVMAAFSTPGLEPIDFVKIGRAVQRFWLTASSLGLSVQPLTGVLYFRLRIFQGEGTIFSAREKKRILDAYDTVLRVFGLTREHVVFMCRIGRGPGPSARATRFPLSDVYTRIS